jgi:hypothetical protein
MRQFNVQPSDPRPSRIESHLSPPYSVFYALYKARQFNL